MAGSRNRKREFFIDWQQLVRNLAHSIQTVVFYASFDPTKKKKRSDMPARRMTYPKICQLSHEDSLQRTADPFLVDMARIWTTHKCCCHGDGCLHRYKKKSTRILSIPALCSPTYLDIRMCTLSTSVENGLPFFRKPYDMGMMTPCIERQHRLYISRITDESERSLCG